MFGFSCLSVVKLETLSFSMMKVCLPYPKYFFVMNHFSVPGHTVTGVEGVPFVVEQFFRENNLDYDKVHMIIIIVLLIQQTLKIYNAV